MKRNMHPLVSTEIPDFDINKAINNGMIPRHYMASNPWKRLSAYVGIYLNEEIREEAFSRNLHSFIRFIEVAAMSNGEMIVYKNIAQDCGIDYRTVKEYFEILQDTLFGYLIPGFIKTVKRKAIQAPKFYYYDVGIANYLLKRKNIEQGTVAFGSAFEHFIMQELIAYIAYNNVDEDITYWRSKSGYEVDCIIGNGRIAIEIKSNNEVKSRHFKGLNAFSEDFPNARRIVVPFDKYYRKTNDVEIFPVMDFLTMLWKGEIISHT